VTDPAETARALGFATAVAGVRMPFCVMNAAGTAATADDVRRLRRSRTGAIVLMTATVHPFVHPGFRELHNPGFDKLLPLVRELAADAERPVVASVAGATVDEIGFLARAFADAGAAAIEATLADRWVESTLAPLDDPATLHALASRLAACGRPAWVKLPERVRMPYALLVGTLLDAGVRAVVAHHEFQGYEKLMVEAPAPIDVIVGGGITTGFEVLRAIHKGAKAVQLGPELRVEGYRMFARLEADMRKAVEVTIPAPDGREPTR
jgi:dihydroorotate dehydrogenase